MKGDQRFQLEGLQRKAMEMVSIEAPVSRVLGRRLDACNPKIAAWMTTAIYFIGHRICVLLPPYDENSSELAVKSAVGGSGVHVSWDILVPLTATNLHPTTSPNPRSL
jgi:hypothetical protein